MSGVDGQINMCTMAHGERMCGRCSQYVRVTNETPKHLNTISSTHSEVSIMHITVNINVLNWPVVICRNLRLGENVVLLTLKCFLGS